MITLGFLYHPDYLKHDTGHGHPETPQRLEAIIQHLLSLPLWSTMSHLRPEPSPLGPIHAVHPERHTTMLKVRCHQGESVLDDGETRIAKASYEVALLAAGAVMKAIDEVMRGTVSRAFCAVRPPGHHAESATAMGFCLLNNVAIGARYAQQHHTLQRVAIVDWDVHHGNGTQEIFYEDDSVFYISLHQYPFYPGTGSSAERGKGRGEGFTLNCPMGAGSVEKDYLDAFHSQIIPALERFKPELLVVSAGFDAHKDDPLASIQLTEDSYAKMTALLSGIAEKYCGGRIVSVLEGGYNLQALARSVEAHLRALSA